MKTKKLTISIIAAMIIALTAVPTALAEDPTISVSGDLTPGSTVTFTVDMEDNLAFDGSVTPSANLTQTNSTPTRIVAIGIAPLGTYIYTYTISESAQVGDVISLALSGQGGDGTEDLQTLEASISRQVVAQAAPTNTPAPTNAPGPTATTAPQATATPVPDGGREDRGRDDQPKTGDIGSGSDDSTGGGMGLWIVIGIVALTATGTVAIIAHKRKNLEK